MESLRNSACGESAALLLDGSDAIPLRRAFLDPRVGFATRFLLVNAFSRHPQIHRRCRVFRVSSTMASELPVSPDKTAQTPPLFARRFSLEPTPRLSRPSSPPFLQLRRRTSARSRRCDFERMPFALFRDVCRCSLHTPARRGAARTRRFDLSALPTYPCVRPSSSWLQWVAFAVLLAGTVFFFTLR